MTTHIGALGEDLDGKARERMARNLNRLGDLAADQGITLAAEAGLESGPRLQSIIEDADTKGLGVNFDPTNPVMNGFDYLEPAWVLST